MPITLFAKRESKEDMGFVVNGVDAEITLVLDLAAKDTLTLYENGEAKPVTLSDSTGLIHDPEGIDRDKLKFVIDLKNVRRGRIAEYAATAGELSRRSAARAGCPGAPGAPGQAATCR